MNRPEHHKVIIVGGGPAGLGFTAVLGGWQPWYRACRLFQTRHAQLHGLLDRLDGSLMELDFHRLLGSGLAPADLFRILHHPASQFPGLDQIPLDFRQGKSIDYLVITQEQVGGVWNNVPQNMLTLSPGHWMELAFYPLAQHAQEIGLDLNVNDLILKKHLIDYYHRVPERFEQQNQIRTGEKVTRIEPNENGFLLTSKIVSEETTKQYTCNYLIYAVGQRCILRRLEVPGEDLPFISRHYLRPEDYPGERVVVVGGGRTADWAAAELHDAGREVHYVMRQTPEHHWRLISDSRYGLPYYGRLAEIIESRSQRFLTYYQTHMKKFEERPEGGLVTITANDSMETLEVEHAIVEIGGIADYSIFHGFPPLSLVEKHDSYRFQVQQGRIHPHNYESIDIPNLYLGGYLAEGIGLVVIGMHGTTYAIAADIMRKENLISQ
jgi:thioredoxin reductase